MSESVGDEISQTADATKCKEVSQSYGVCTEILNWFTKTDQVVLQRLSPFFYSVAVSRVQTRFSLQKTQPLLLTYPFASKFGKVVFCVNPRTFETTQITHPSFEFNQYSLVQVKDDLFAYLEHIKHMEWVQYRNVTSQSSIQRVLKQVPLLARVEPILCNWQDKVVLVTGGTRGTPKADVQCYNIAAECWSSVQEMNKDRHWHSACSLGDSVYVFGGISKGQNVNSFEVFDVATYLENQDDEANKWKLILFKENKPLYTRYNCTLAPYSDTELLISGGRGNRAMMNTCLFNINDHAVRVLTTNEQDDQAAYSTRKNQGAAIVVAGNQGASQSVKAVLSIVLDNKSYEIKLVGVIKGTQKLQELHNFGPSSSQ